MFYINLDVSTVYVYFKQSILYKHNDCVETIFDSKIFL